MTIHEACTTAPRQYANTFKISVTEGKEEAQLTFMDALPHVGEEEIHCASAVTILLAGPTARRLYEYLAEIFGKIEDF